MMVASLWLTPKRYRPLPLPDLSASPLAIGSQDADKSEGVSELSTDFGCGGSGGIAAPRKLRAMFPGTDDHDQLSRQAVRQCGVLHRDQFRNLGVSRATVASQIAGRRWTGYGQNVVLLKNSPPTRTQLMWLAVLDAGEDAALGSHTALELAGFKGFAREAADIHLIVQRGARATPLLGVRVHESRRLNVEELVDIDGLRRTETARSVIDAAAWQPFPRFACLMVAAAVQQRVTTPASLDEAMRTVGRIRHKAYLRLALADVREGAQSLGELDLARLCRRFGLVRPRRQALRRDRSGRIRYLDAEWDLPSGEICVLRSTVVTTWTSRAGRKT